MVRDLHLNNAEAAAILPAPHASASRPVNPAQVAVAWMAGGAATLAAVVVGSVLAVVFAATLALVLVIAAAALTLLAVTWRVRRPRALQGPTPGDVIEARKVGHSWVAYGWDQPS